MDGVDVFWIVVMCLGAYLGYKSFKKHGFGDMKPSGKKSKVKMVMTMNGDMGVVVEPEPDEEVSSHSAEDKYQQWEKDTSGEQGPDKKIEERIDEEHLPLLQGYVDEVSRGKIKLEYTKRKQYIVVHLVGQPRSWICRLYDVYHHVDIEAKGSERIRMYLQPKLTKKIQAALDKAIAPYLDE